jgi:hypothetical protein
LFYRLSKFWLVAEDYQYGWAAPVLMAFTLYRRRKILLAGRYLVVCRPDHCVHLRRAL